MKKSSLAAVFYAICLTASGGAFAETCTGSVSEGEALQAEDARYKAQTSSDFDALRKLFADDMIYSHSSGMIDGKAGYLGKQTSGALQYRTMKRSNVKVRTFDCLAIITGRGAFDVAVNGKINTVDLVFHSIWVKRGKDMQFVSFQSTPAPH